LLWISAYAQIFLAFLLLLDMGWCEGSCADGLSVPSWYVSPFVVLTTYSVHTFFMLICAPFFCCYTYFYSLKLPGPF
jgi:hypothetical protein